MAENITPEEIADAIAEILGDEKSQGTILDDKKFAVSNPDLIRLLKSQADDTEWRGWIVDWTGIPNQNIEGDCVVDTTYRFSVLFLHFYNNDYKPGLSSDMNFKRLIFAASESLNRSFDLGLGNLVRHQGLISQAEFLTDDEGGGAVSEKSHLALFTLDVTVTNRY